MKRKLQVKRGDVWLWVAMAQRHITEPMTTTCKAQAMPAKTYWFTDSLAIMSKRYPDHEFRLAESRDE